MLHSFIRECDYCSKSQMVLNIKINDVSGLPFRPLHTKANIPSIGGSDPPSVSEEESL